MSNKRKILQILPELGSGGVERGTIEVASALQLSGYEAHIASAGGNMVEQLTEIGAKHYKFPLTSKNPLTMWLNIQRIVSIIKRENIDIVHARSRAPAWSAYYAAQKTKTPFITTFHGAYNGKKGSLKHRYNSVMVKGEKIIAVSDFIGQHIQNEYDIDPQIIRVVHRGADIEYFDPAKVNGVRTQQICKEWSAPDGLPIILLPGRLTRWKGQHVLLEALGKLEHKQFFCVLLGEAGKHPAYVKELEQKVSEYKLEGRVRMVSATTQMRAAYNAANIIVSPAIEPEAFGRVPVEAQAMGKPIIATSHGGAMETVITGENGTGWLVTPGNSDELAKAISEALSLNDQDKEMISTNAQQHVIDNFSTERMCKKVIQVYEEVLQNNKKQKL